MGASFKRTGHAETDDVLARGERVMDELRALEALLTAMGNTARAMDIREAMESLRYALEYDA